MTVVLRFKRLEEEGWITLPEAAVILGVSRQDVEKIVKSSRFDDEDVRTAGGGGRPIYFVRVSAVEHMRDNSGDVTAELLAV